MAFNPYFPATYGQNPYQLQMMQNQLSAMQQSPMMQQQGGLIWVQGIEGAKSHPISAGQSVLLMDSESNCFFIKSADTSGMPLPLRIFDYTERNGSPEPQKQPSAAGIDVSGFITREEFEARIAQLSASQGQPRKTSKKDGVNDGE